MLPAKHISRKTFFAAAAFFATGFVPANAYLFEDEVTDSDWNYTVNDIKVAGKYKLLKADVGGDDTDLGTFAAVSIGANGQPTYTPDTPSYKTFVKTGTGTLQAYVGEIGSLLYNGHNLGYTYDDLANDGAYYYYRTVVENGSNTGKRLNGSENRFEFSTASDSEDLSAWKGGELVVEEGTLNLIGYVNAWFDFGSEFNEYRLKGLYGDDGYENGLMTGVSLITVSSGATLDLSGNINFGNSSVTHAQMVADGSRTTFQFLHNLQAGKDGTAVGSELVLGTASNFHVNIHVEDWSENTRIDTGVEAGDGGHYYADSSLAFGGSIGTIAGAGSIYKTGTGAFTILGSNPGFEGSLYAAGGELVLAAENNVGDSTITFEPIAGTVLKAKISSSVESAESVNIVGTDGGQGSKIVRIENYNVVNVDPNTQDTEALRFVSVKESYFTTPAAGTLVISTNQSIKNFQSYFAAGKETTGDSSDDYYPSNGKKYQARVESVITSAIKDDEGLLSPVGSVTQEPAQTGTSDAPIISGTGKGSKLVIAGANFVETEKNGVKEYTALVDEDGYVKGGVLLITQEDGKGGIYQGSIVGAKVKLYNKNKFADETEKIETKKNGDTISDAPNKTVSNDKRKEDALLSDDDIKEALGAIYGESNKDSKFSELKKDTDDGSIALDNETAIDLVNYIQSKNGILESSSGSSSSNDSANSGITTCYVEYEADSSVRGGTLVLDGAGDLAFLLEDANYSGVYIASTRTGKTVFNIAALNSFSGQELSLGNSNGSVSFVVNISETFCAKLTGFGVGSSLTFAVAEDIETISGNIIVGGTRQTTIEFEYVQDSVYGTVYVERGLTLNLNKTANVFPNAKAIVVHQGDTNGVFPGPAAPTLSVSSDQLVNNLTGDADSQLLVKNGSVLTINADSNDIDSASGLALSTFNGNIYGNGSIVKGGSKTLTLGGTNSASKDATATGTFTGTLEIGEGALNVTSANSLSGISSLILNAGTTATMSGDQALRTIYGAGTLSVGGTLTVGANAKPEAGSNRYYVANNLGSSSESDYLATGDTTISATKSFERFKGKYNREGNYVSNNEASSKFTQVEDTKKYLVATSTLAYSGFNVSALEAFVDSGVLSSDDYEKLKDAAEDANWDSQISPLKITIGGESMEEYADSTPKKHSNDETVSAETLLTSLEKLYSALQTKETYEDYFYTGTKDKKGKEKYSAYGTGTQNNNKLRDLYIETYGREDGIKNYNTFINGDGTKKSYTELVANYDELIEAQRKDFFDNNFKKDMTLAEAQALFSEFYSVKNPGGTALFSEEEFFKTYGNYDFGALADDEVAALRSKYAELYVAKEAIAVKSNFAGIEISGAFANDVNTDNSVVVDWASDLAFSGNITSGNFAKTGDSTIKLTGTLTTGSLVINGGTLEIESSTLAGTLVGGITLDRGANLSVNTDEGVVATFAQNVLGTGNFVKTGDGKLILPDGVRYSGTTEIAGGTLQLRLRNSIPAEKSDTGSVILPQGDITFTSSNTSLILAQGDDLDAPVTWNSKISVKNGTSTVSGVSLEKTGEAALTLTKEVSLGESANLTVSAGTLTISGELKLGKDADVSIESGAVLELAGTSSAISEALFYGEGALRILGVASIEGKKRDLTIGPNGTTSAFDNFTTFTGAVTIGSKGSLTLTGESVFDFAREVMLNSEATLTIGNETGTSPATTQTVRALSGTGTVDINSGATLNVVRDGERLETSYSEANPYYAFNEDVLISAPNFAGTLSGTGTLKISGNGLSRFTGTIKKEENTTSTSQLQISIDDGGQAVFNAKDFNAKVTVNSTTAKKDSNGNKIVAHEGKNYTFDAKNKTFEEDTSSTTASNDNLKIRTIRTTGGELVDVVAEKITLKVEETKKNEKTEYKIYFVRDGARVYVASVAEWDYVTGTAGADSKKSLNWGLKKTGNGKYITGSELENLITLKVESGKITTEVAKDYSIGFYQLSETADGTFVASTGTSDSLKSEVIFTVVAGETADLSSSQVVFNGTSGEFGKVGDGTLNITNAKSMFEGTNNGSSSSGKCAQITVYEGTLHLNEWVATEKVIVENATLEIDLGTVNSYDFTSVIGSGTLALTADANQSISIVANTNNDGSSGSGTGSSGNSSGINPTEYQADGKYFNGTYLFKNPKQNAGGSYNVTATGVALPAIGTEDKVKLTLDNVTIQQTQNSEIQGEVTIQKSLTIAGTAKDGSSGSVLSENLRILTMSGSITSSNGLTVKNVGLGFSAKTAKEKKISIKVDNESFANSFFIKSDESGDGKVGENVKIYATKDTLESAKLKDFSIIKTGTGTVTYDLKAVIDSTKNLGASTGSSNDSADYFGVTASIYDALYENSGSKMYLGVSEGQLVISNLDKAVSEDGTLSVYNAPVDLDLITLRSTTGATSGTLVFGATSSVTRATPETVLFAESIRGGGNVEFNQKGLTSSAKQYYTGQTLIAADTTFSGAGRELSSSFVQVASGATLSGGVILSARNVDYSIFADRGVDDDGTAGKTALTITIDDPRLPSGLKCTLNITSDLSSIEENSLQELGNGIAGVSISNPSYNAETGILTLTVTDTAYAQENSTTEKIGGASITSGDAYQIAIDISKSIPLSANTTRTSSGTASVAGDFTANAGSTISLDAAAGDKVSVGAGTIQLDGATIVRNLNDSTRGKTLTLFSASKISRSGTSGTAAVIKSLSEGNDSLKKDGEAMMKLVVYSDAATGEIRAQMVTDNFAEVNADYNEAASNSFLNALSLVATNGNGQRDRLLINGDTITGDQKSLLLALNSLTTDQLGSEVTKLSPALFGSMLAMPVAAFNSDIARLHARLDQRRYDGADPLRERGEYEFFVLAQSDFTENDSATDTPTFDYNLYGATAGFDWKPNYQTTLGLAVGYTYGKAKADNGGGKVDMDDMRVTAFASHLFDNFYLEYGLQLGYAAFDTKRETIAGKASGDTNSIFAGEFVTGGMVQTIFYDKKTGEGLYFTPSVGLSFFQERIDGFTEDGAAGLKLDDADGNSLRARVAAGIQWSFPLAELQMRLGAEVAYSHDFLGEELDWDGEFNAYKNTKFSSSAKAMGTDTFSFSPSLDIMFSHKTSAFLGYGIDVNFDSGITQSINAGFRHRF